MKQTPRWVLIAAAGLILLLLPTLIRMLREQGQAPLPAAAAAYTPPAVATPALAVTPIPTATPIQIAAAAGLPDAQLARGPVVVDLAHFSLIERAKFQPLTSALAEYSLDLRFWLPTVDTSNIKGIADFPDQSADLSKQLSDASGLVVISPFFLYTPAEIAVVERFMADGGRLLIISDPDVESDSASDTNQLASVFNVVFNDDYLYDTVKNDENFTYFFQGEFDDQAADLAGSRIAFYGGRSIGGAVEPQVRSAATTLSSVRNGLTSFNTVVLGGSPATGSSGHVLAMSDFDVLTDPYVTRYDNRRMLQFVTDFLAGAARENNIADFPSFLGKEVALAIDNSRPVGALALAKAAELQRVLEASGRQMTLAISDKLTDTLSGGRQDSPENSPKNAGPDLIYVAGYRAADSRTPLLRDLGIRLQEEVVTPTVSATGVTTVAVTGSISTTPPSAEAAPPDEVEQPEAKTTPITPVAPVPEEPTITPAAPPEVPPPLSTTPVTGTQSVTGSLPLTGTQIVTGSAPLTGTAAEAAGAAAEPATATPAPTASATPQPSASPTPTLTPTPQVRLLLERSDGLSLVADETLLFVRNTSPSGAHTLAVLANSEQAISVALTRLLNRDFNGCLRQTDLVICPYSPGSPGAGGPPNDGALNAATPAPTPAAGREGTPPAAPEGTPAITPALTPGAPPQAPGAPDAERAAVLVVDDNSTATADEPSEAAIYLTVLTAAGYRLDNWVTSEQGLPEGKDLIPYQWVIWSDAGYATSGVDGDSLRAIGEYINQGGRLTISSRMPFFGVGAKAPSVVRDIVVAGEVPELVAGLPETPIALTSTTPPLSPLEKNPDQAAGASMALARGPTSADAGAPVLILMTDAGFEEPKGALLMLFGLSMGWLPPDVSEQLIQNMATVMLAQ